MCIIIKNYDHFRRIIYHEEGKYTLYDGIEDDVEKINVNGTKINDNKELQGVDYGVLTLIYCRKKVLK